MLPCSERAFEAVVVGAGGGIGAAVCNALLQNPDLVALHRLARSARGEDQTIQFDLLKEETILTAAGDVQQRSKAPIRLIFVATGILHDGDQLQPEKDWRALDADRLIHAYQINCVGPALLAKHFLPLLPRQGRSVFAALSARVGSISDNHLGGWYGYRASKAALNQMIRTLSIELARKRKEAICVAMHPGTVDTGLSGPFQAGVSDDRLFTPDYSAERMLAVIAGLGQSDSGGLFAWDGTRLSY